MSDLPRMGRRRPSEDDSVPPPQAPARGWRWWALTMAVLAGRRVSSRRYHRVVQSMSVGGDAGELGHAGSTEVAGLGEDGGVEVAAVLQAGMPRLAPPAWVSMGGEFVSRSTSMSSSVNGTMGRRATTASRSAQDRGSRVSAVRGLRWSWPSSSRRTGLSAPARRVRGRRGSGGLVLEGGQAFGERGGHAGELEHVGARHGPGLGAMR